MTQSFARRVTSIGLSRIPFPGVCLSLRIAQESFLSGIHRCFLDVLWLSRWGFRGALALPSRECAQEPDCGAHGWPLSTLLRLYIIMPACSR